MRLALGLFALWLAACGRVGFDPFGEDASTGTDGEPVAPRCDPAKPYGTPALLDKISSSFPEIGVKLVDDTLSGVLWTMSGPDRIYETSRASPTSEFTDRRLMTELLEVASPPASDRDPGISGDGLTIVFASQRPQPGGGGGDWDLWMATRRSRTDVFDAPKPVTELNTAAAEWGTTMSSSGLAIYYVLGEDLAVARRRSTSEPFVVDTTGTMTALNAPGPDFEVVVAADERTIFFSRIGTGFDIWSSQRATKADPFPPPKPLTELTEGGDEWTGWVSPDLCEIYFARSNGATSWDLYVARRPL